MPNEQQGRPIANLSPDERAMFRKSVTELQGRRKESSIRMTPARPVIGPHIADAPPRVQAALRHLIERDEQGPAFGEMAPDFSLKCLDSGERVSLSGFRGASPVALVFGSYT